MKPAEITHVARSLLGKPFRHQGRDPATGFDCVGFWLYLARSCGFWPADFVDDPRYGRSPQAELTRLVELHTDPAPAAVEGALLTFRWTPTQVPSHVAYCTGPTLIHCYERIGEVVEHGYRDRWLRMTVQRRWPRGVVR